MESWVPRRRPRREIGPQDSVFNTLEGQQIALLNQWVVPEVVRRFARDAFDWNVAAASAEGIVSLYRTNRAAFEGIMQQALIIAYAADEFDGVVDLMMPLPVGRLMQNDNPALAVLTRYYGGSASVTSIEAYGRKLGKRLFEAHYKVSAQQVFDWEHADYHFVDAEKQKQMVKLREYVDTDTQVPRMPEITAGAAKTGTVL
jgi:hypothetical protein